MQSPGIPIQKSREYTNIYLSRAKEFGQIVLDIYDKLQTQELKHGIEVEGYFDSLMPLEKYWWRTTPHMYPFPFREATNPSGLQFPSALCISINDCIAHGIPSEKLFEEGDIISVDLGFTFTGGVTDLQGRYHDQDMVFDAAFTVVYGEDKLPGDHWTLAPLQALRKIPETYAVKTLQTKAISTWIEQQASLSRQNTNIITSLSGHGIGKELHEPPCIYNIALDSDTSAIPPNSLFCPEPMYSLGDSYPPDIESVYIAEDGWSVMTASGAPATHFETVFCYLKENGEPRLIDALGIIEKLYKRTGEEDGTKSS